MRNRIPVWIDGHKAAGAGAVRINLADQADAGILEAALDLPHVIERVQILAEPVPTRIEGKDVLLDIPSNNPMV